MTSPAGAPAATTAPRRPCLPACDMGSPFPGRALVSARRQCYVSRRRATLQPGRVGGDPGTVLLARPPGYLLRADADQVDASRFEQLVAEAQSQTAGDDAAVRILDDALGLWRGRAFAEFA